MVESAPIPVTLLAGFLGSGKTTLLNRILAERHGERIAVVVNEFGDVGIDGRLVVGVDDNVVELSNGCVCCTVREDLGATLIDLLERRGRRFLKKARFERVLIEASGLASPGPILQTLEVLPLLSPAMLADGVVTMAHSVHLCRQLAEHPEAADQVGYADKVVLNHADQASAEELGRAEAAVRARNALATVQTAVRAELDVGELLTIGTRDPGRWRLVGHDHDADCDHQHSESIRTLSFESEVPLDLHKLKMWIQFVAARRTHEVLRLKGIFACQDHPRPVVVQGVYQWLELGPGEGPVPARSQLVLIGRDLDREELERGWQSLFG